MCITSSARARKGKHAKDLRREQDWPEEFQDGSRPPPACLPMWSFTWRHCFLVGKSVRIEVKAGIISTETTKVRLWETRLGECRRETGLSLYPSILVTVAR